MIYAYGITVQGTYHIKNDIVCQDAHNIVKKDKDIVIAAVADGLGSEKYSDIASKIAAKRATTFCAEKITKSSSEEDILKTIKAAFTASQDEIEKTAAENGHSVDEYDSTLSLSVLMGEYLYYGHVGDSGIIVLTSDGLYKQVTEQQRDEDNRLYPLFFRDRWIFKKFEEKVCSVFLATDGIFEIMFPYLIKDEEVNIHIALARFLMDNHGLRIEKRGEDAVKADVEDFIKNIPDAQVNDDKTLVVLINASVESKIQPDEYYKEPDWEGLKKKRDEEYKRQAYPHLFKDKPEEKKADDKSDKDVAGPADGTDTTSPDDKSEAKKENKSDAKTPDASNPQPETKKEKGHFGWWRGDKKK